MSQMRANKKRDTVTKTKVDATGVEARDLPNSSTSSANLDYSMMSVGEIMNSILARTKDPEIEKMVNALKSKIPQDLTDAMEAHERERSVVVYNLPEAASELSPSRRQIDLEDKVSSMLDILGVECRPAATYRMGEFREGKPRLVKIVLPSKTHWKRVLSNAYKLRSSNFQRVFIRRRDTRRAHT